MHFFPYLERGMTLAEETDFPGAIANGAWSLANVYNQTGQTDDAVRISKRAWNFAEPGGFLYFGGLALLQLARGYSLNRDFEPAVSTVAHALSLAKKGEFRALEAQANFMRGEILMCVPESDLTDARTAYHAATSLAKKLEMRPLTAHSHAGLGRLHHFTGKKTQAKKELIRACEMYRDLGMTYYLQKAEQDLASLA